MSEQSLVRPAHGHWFLHPYVQLCFGAIMVTASELLLKRGAEATKELATGWLGFTVLSSGWTWVGVLTYITAFISWLHVLRYLPVNIAFALMSVVQVLVPLGAWYFLHEAIHPAQWCGILLVLAGITVIAKPLMKAEERL